MLTPRQRIQAKKNAYAAQNIARKQEAQRLHPEWFQATHSKAKKHGPRADKATPIYSPEKLGKTPTTRSISRYRKKVRRGI